MQLPSLDSRPAHAEIAGMYVSPAQLHLPARMHAIHSMQHSQCTLYQTAAQWLTASANSAETGDLYDDDASEISLEVGAEAGPEFETHVQERLQSASVAQSGPTTDEGVPSAVAPQHSSLRRFSKDHAVSDDIQKRFMIAVEDDDKAAKKRVQEWLVRSCALWDTETPLLSKKNLFLAWCKSKACLGEC
jgi:hypothetical protein